jgi:hypothetical protein
LGWDEPAAFPDRQDPSETIAVERLAHRRSIDGDRAARSTDNLTWKGGDML